MNVVRPWLGSVVLLVASNGAWAADLFDVSVHTTSGPAQTINTSGNNLSDLVTHLVKGEQQFSSLANRNVTATLGYAGIANAIEISRNAANTSVTVQVPSIGLNKTFTGRDANGLKNQIIDYVKQSGAAEYAQFLRVVDRQSPAGVTDGNPLAATAVLADHQYATFGLEPAPWLPANISNRLDSVSTPRIRFDYSGGTVSTGAGDGYFITGATEVGFRLADQVGLVFSTPFTYHTLEGAKIYDVGEEIAVPMGLLPARNGDGLSWTLTPAGVAGAAGSLEMAAGGTFAGGGLTSSLSYRLGSFTFTLADHASYFHGYPIHVGDYHFDTNLEQVVVKNGVKVTKSFGNALYLDAGITYTNFVRAAAIDHYWTPTAGLGVRFGPRAGLRVGYEGDFGHGYRANGGDVQLYFNY